LTITADAAAGYTKAPFGKNLIAWGDLNPLTEVGSSVAVGTEESICAGFVGAIAFVRTGVRYFAGFC